MKNIQTLNADFQSDKLKLQNHALENRDEPLSHYIDTKLDIFRNGINQRSKIIKWTEKIYKYSEDIQKGYMNTINNNFHASKRIPYNDVEFGINMEGEPNMLISMLGYVPSIHGINSNPNFMEAVSNQFISDIMTRLITNASTPVDQRITLSFLLIGLYLIFNGNVVSYIIDPSCKGDSLYTETVMSYIPIDPDITERHKIIEKIKPYKGQHLVDESVTGKSRVNYNEEYTRFIKRQQYEGFGKHKSKVNKSKHKSKTKKKNNKKYNSTTKKKQDIYNKKSNTRRRRLRLRIN
jgi:hypothetical protein